MSALTIYFDVSEILLAAGKARSHIIVRICGRPSDLLARKILFSGTVAVYLRYTTKLIKRIVKASLLNIIFAERLDGTTCLFLIHWRTLGTHKSANVCEIIFRKISRRGRFYA